jgi:uncharacterized flavoprotein (TIGR03862 family)
MAADVISAAGIRVDLYDAMPSVGRKFLLAGIGGLNLTHAEPAPAFRARFGARQAALQAALDDFDAAAVRAWAQELGIDTFVGSSGRVFPTGMKAAPLLRSWLRRLRSNGVALHPRQRWIGWSDDGALRIADADGDRTVPADAVVLAMGGGSWARLGSDGAWVPWLAARAVDVAPLRPANSGFNTRWSLYFSDRFAGQPLKAIAIGVADSTGTIHYRRGEGVITRHGIEGSVVYALSAPLRDAIERDGAVTVWIDLAPDRDAGRIATALARPRGSKSLAKHLHGAVGIDGLKAALLREVLDADAMHDMARVATTIKALPLKLTATRPLDEAISSAGGVRFESLDADFMLRAIPGCFCAGEMLDWEAPTGGYLLTACLATGRRAGLGAIRWLQEK